MRNELSEIEKTEQYLEGKLSAADKALFEQALQADPVLQQEVMLQQAIMDRMEVHTLKSIIREVHPGSNSSRFNLFLLFGGLLLCLVAAYVYYTYTGKSEKAKLADAPLPVASSAHTRTDTHTDTASASLPANTQTVTSRAIVSKPVLPTPSQASDKASEAHPPTPPLPPSYPKTSDGKPAPASITDTASQHTPFDNKNFVVPFKSYTLNADKGGYIRDTRSGTMIYFQPEMLMGSTGKVVKGNVKILYREFRNAADMVCSGIPMTWKKGDSTFNFNSAGMFEIYALKGTDTLHPKPGTVLSVNFLMTQDVEGLAFYKLSKEQQNWKEIGPIEPLSADSVKKRHRHGLSLGIEGHPIFHRNRQKNVDYNQEAATEQDLVLNSSVTTTKPVFKYIPSDASTTFASTTKTGTQPTLVQGDGPLSGSGMNTGHTYPALVQGLRCSGFGVYNCDQAYRIKNPISIQPIFTDSLGKTIAKQYVLCLIDLDYNSSFSFDPREPFQLSKGGRTILLLFTTDKRVFAFTQEQFRQTGLAGSGAHTFSMTEFTKKVKNTADLKRYMGLRD